MARSPFHLVISDLRALGAERAEAIAASVDWNIEMSAVLPDPPLLARLTMRTIAGGLLVTGPVTFTVRHTCHRCLDEWEEAMEIRVAQLFAAAGDEELAEADYHYRGDDLDVEPMLRDEVLLTLPLAPTCRPDCPGLEPQPETGLNTDASEDAAPSPFAVLKDLFDGSE